MGCCLNSLIAQSYTDWKCIIIDDGSTDNTQETAFYWLARDKRISYKKISNSGVCIARNTGVYLAGTEYVLPLDADDYLSRNYIEEAISVINKNTNVKVAFGRLIVFGSQSELSPRMKEYSFDKLKKENFIHCSGVYRKSDFIEIGGYDMNMVHGWEDWEFWINMLKRGGVAEEIESCFLFYRRNVVASRNNNLLASQKKMDIMYNYIYNKHSYKNNSINQTIILFKIKSIIKKFTYCKW